MNLQLSLMCYQESHPKEHENNDEVHFDYHANSSKNLNIISVYHFKAAFTYWIRLINGQLIYGEIL